MVDSTTALISIGAQAAHSQEQSYLIQLSAAWAQLTIAQGSALMPEALMAAAPALSGGGPGSRLPQLLADLCLARAQPRCYVCRWRRDASLPRCSLSLSDGRCCTCGCLTNAWSLLVEGLAREGRDRGPLCWT